MSSTSTTPAAPASLLAGLLPGPGDPRARWYDGAAWLWLAGALAVALWTYQDYGVTWDESPHLAYGTRIHRWYTSGFHDRAALTFRTNYFYGGGFDLLGALFRRLAAPLGAYPAIHLLGCLVGVLGLAGAWRLGRVLAGPRAGLFALILLTLSPVYWGHMFNNPKDSPFAAAYAWSLALLIATIAALPRPSRMVLAKLALAVGLALSVRIAGLVLICFLGLALVLFAAHAGWIRRSAASAWAHLRQLGRVGLGVTAGAWLVMLIGWPWAQLDPLRRPFIALARMSSFDAHKRKMPFAGEEIWNFDIGWDYLPRYFALQMPELVVLALIFGTIYAVHALIRHGLGRAHHRAALALLVLLLSIWLPPLYAIARGSILYDGYRHFLFLLPPICALVAVVLDRGLTVLGRVGRPALALGTALLLACGVDVALQMRRLHPHEYVYFNRFIGGLAGAVDNYDTDYYGNSFKEAFAGLKEYLWATEPERYLGTIYNYGGCISPRTARHYTPPNFRGSREAPPGAMVDFFAGYQRHRCFKRHPTAPVVYTVERDGGPLNLVKDLRGLDVPAKRKRKAKKSKKKMAPEDPA